ncbi:MAG: GGDEF domain-containing protein [Phycisphaerales bacterium]|nr:GGDEF domain-containing protein [Phycisphaerales bacterium]MCB9837029.1 GGDEF domain-containing protein [Phycisphaera sp.]
MSGHGTTQGRTGQNADPVRARVVLVGRTGLDAKLRLDLDLELIRSRTALEAIGELGNPVGGAAERTFVIVGHDADIGGRTGSADEFVDAVHRVVRGARVLVLKGLNHIGHEAYEGVVDPSISTAELRSIIHPGDGAVPQGDTGTPIFSVERAAPVLHEQKPTPESNSNLEPEPIVVPDSEEEHDIEPFRDPALATDTDDLSEEELMLLASELEPEPEALEEPMTRIPEPVREDVAPVERDDYAPLGAMEMASMESVSREGDGPLVAAMLGGRGVIEPAMEMLRSRASRTDLEFVKAEGDRRQPTGGVVVEFGGRIFGWVVAKRDPEALTPRHEPVPGGLTLGEHARWLAGWLALADQHRRLRAEAMTDRVSGAWNRRYFDRFLSAAIEQARANRQMLTVLVFDLDNFKQFNDEFGHEAGDMILRETVNLMHSQTRPTDRICRIGGDEFAVIFYEPEGPRDQHSRHPTHFAEVAERFQRAIKEQRFPRLGIDAPGRLTISGGLATFPWDGATPEDLLRKADQLAMESKRAGKNGITLGGLGG